MFRVAGPDMTSPSVFDLKISSDDDCENKSICSTASEKESCAPYEVRVKIDDPRTHSLQSTKSASSATYSLCRICQSETGNKIYPCLCAGTMGGIHETQRILAAEPVEVAEYYYEVLTLIVFAFFSGTGYDLYRKIKNYFRKQRNIHMVQIYIVIAFATTLCISIASNFFTWRILYVLYIKVYRRMSSINEKLALADGLLLTRMIPAELLAEMSQASLFDIAQNEIEATEMFNSLHNPLAESDHLNELVYTADEASF
ncbi:hypothetical protein Ddc_09527 [Ditylenchus destructor]|nr:hypothetical protein Ddc_09527 [Ditylenchus destructor]